MEFTPRGKYTPG